MSLLVSCFKAVFEGAWRRWFGGGAKDYLEYKGLKEDSTWWTKLLCSRGTQTFVNYIFLSICFYCSFDIANTVFGLFPGEWKQYIEDYSWILAIYNAIVFQSLFWSKGHGPIFDYGHGTVTPETIKRYNSMWFTKFLDKWWEKHYPVEKKYGYFYDCLSMLIRYTYPCVLVSLTAGWYILPLGLCCTGCYAIMWGIFDADTWFFENKKPWFNIPTKIAEVLIGLIVGFYL